jgi:hypothetical protein
LLPEAMWASSYGPVGEERAPQEISTPRRKRAATETSSFVERPRKRWRSSSGALTRKPWSSLELWLAACVLALMAERRAARRAP